MKAGLLLLLMSAAWACGDGDPNGVQAPEPTTLTFEGTVTVNGVPAPGSKLRLEYNGDLLGYDPVVVAECGTDASGRYALTARIECVRGSTLGAPRYYSISVQLIIDSGHFVGQGVGSGSLRCTEDLQRFDFDQPVALILQGEVSYPGPAFTSTTGVGAYRDGAAAPFYDVGVRPDRRYRMAFLACPVDPEPFRLMAVDREHRYGDSEPAPVISCDPPVQTIDLALTER
jgi:hypothetical protein